MTRIVSFGEIMLRLNPPGYQRLVQADTLEVSYAGGEANVAVSLACLGLDSAYVSTVPANALGDSAVNALRRFGVDTSWVGRRSGRLGVYFVEKGASQRPSAVLYDRAGSVLTATPPDAYDWPSILDGATWLHLTGITPSLGPMPAQACLDAAKAAHQLGITVSCDLNYRSRLWSRAAAREFMTRLVADVDVCIANEEDPADVFGIAASGSDIDGGALDRDGYAAVARTLAEQFGFRSVAITLRSSISASENDWSGLLYHDGDVYVGPTYNLKIVDRVGGGDSFAAGLIYSMAVGKSPADAIDFAVGASCLKHSIEHDFNLVTAAEVEALVGGAGAGRIQR